MPHLDRLNMPKTLVIVESPTKAKTIAKFLGRDYQVESSFGHVRDLPKSIMGVDIAGGTFQPEYEIPATKKKIVAALRKFAKEANRLIDRGHKLPDSILRYWKIGDYALQRELRLA